jgi:SAM-dependent methyltransferase
MTLPFSQACENNKQPILDILRPLLTDTRRVLEVGSGTGQHAVHFAPALPWLEWQTSDLLEHHPGIEAWLQAEPSGNLRAPLHFDLRHSNWPGDYDAVFSANTAHIMAWPLVQRLIQEAGRHLPRKGLFILYGPFNYKGRYTSPSNEQFDALLRNRNPEQGIRDFEAINEVACEAQLRLEQDNAMPANNRLLVWRKY